MKARKQTETPIDLSLQQYADVVADVFSIISARLWTDSRAVTTLEVLEAPMRSYLREFNYEVD